MRVVVKYGFRVLAGDFSLVQLQMHYIKAQCCTSNLNSIFIDNTISKYPSISMISAGSLRPVPFLSREESAGTYLLDHLGSFSRVDSVGISKTSPGARFTSTKQ